jgi:hypothetical protein
MTLAQWLTPTLALTMPGVASAIPWLLALDVLMVIASIVATAALSLVAIRLEIREPNVALATALATQFRQTAEYLAKVRIVFIGIAVLTVVSWGVLSAVFGINAEWNELFFSLVLGALVLPIYVTVTVLSRAMSRSASVAAQKIDRYEVARRQ